MHFMAMLLYLCIFCITVDLSVGHGRPRRGPRLQHRKHHHPSPTTSNINDGKTDGCTFTSVACDRIFKFRSISGLCNNLHHPEFGSAYSPLKRLVGPAYNGGSAPRGGYNPSSLPSPRMVSRNIHGILDIADNKHSHMLMQWGQFLDHDITLTPVTETRADCSECDSTHPDCFPIQIPSGDPVFPDGSCLEFVRSANGNLRGNSIRQREQLNQITSFIDASNVYGSEVAVSRQLRSFVGGKLRVDGQNMMPASPNQEGCNTTQLRLGQGCFLAGDIRNTEQNLLASMQTLWVREHNKIAEQLAVHARNWNDEKLYLETRRIVGALMQRITYNEFLPPVIGTQIMEQLGILEEPGDQYFAGYNRRCDATIKNEFATAAFRFGHSMVHSLLAVQKQSGSSTTTEEVHSLDGNFFNPHYLYSDPANINGLLLGSCDALGRKFDVNLDEILRNHMFKGNELGFDLASLNIQRGRDHGLPGYKKYREALGFHTKLNTWEDVQRVMPDPAVVNAMRNVYGFEVTNVTKMPQNSRPNGVENIDLFTGMLAEMSANNQKDGLLGEVGKKIVAEQFKLLKDCDRFFYSSNDWRNKGRFTGEQLRELRKMRLSTVLCNHLNENVQLSEYVMLSGGVKQSCSAIKANYIDLNKFVTRGERIFTQVEKIIHVCLHWARYRGFQPKL